MPEEINNVSFIAKCKMSGKKQTDEIRDTLNGYWEELAEKWLIFLLILLISLVCIGVIFYIANLNANIATIFSGFVGGMIPVSFALWMQARTSKEQKASILLGEKKREVRAIKMVLVRISALGLELDGPFEIGNIQISIQDLKKYIDIYFELDANEFIQSSMHSFYLALIRETSILARVPHSQEQRQKLTATAKHEQTFTSIQDEMTGLFGEIANIQNR